MLYVLGGISLLFVLIAFTLTESNASYLLAGYNTLPEEEKKKFNLSAYVPYFRRFHIFLGISFFLFGLLVNFVNENAGGVFVGVYPVLAYLCFIYSSQKYAGKTFTKQYKVTLVIGLATLVFVIGVFAWGFKENQLLVNAKSIKVTGVYGEKIPFAEIKSITLIHSLPDITIRTNGFAAGKVKKGYFNTREGKNIKLLVYSNNQPFILITKKTG